MGAFSTQSTVEARISEARLLTYTDFDKNKTADPATIQAGIDFAWGYIAGRLEPLFGSDVIDTWVLPDDVPPLIGWLSDSLCIYNYSISRPELFPENTAAIFDVVDARLNDIANGLVTIPGQTAPVDDVNVVERGKSDFDPERLPEDMSVDPYWIRPDPRDLSGYPE